MRFRAPRRQRLRSVDVEQDLTQVLIDGDRRVRGGVHAARDPGVDLPQRDLVRDRDRRLQAGTAGLLDVVGRCLGRELGAEHGFAREVAVARMLQDGAGDDLAEPLALQREALDEPVERRGQHVEVGRVRVRPVGARERDPVAADDGDAACLHLVLSPGSMVRIKSSAVRSAGIASLRSHHRPNASAAPRIATESGSTARLSVRFLQRGGDERRQPRAVLADPRRDLPATGQRLVVEHAPRVAVGVQEREERVDAGAQRLGRVGSGLHRETTAVNSASPAGFMHARYSCSLLPK